MQQQRQKSGNGLLDDFEAELIQSANFLNDQAKKYQDMKEKYSWLVEYKHVLAKSKEIQVRSLSESISASEGKSNEKDELLLQSAEITQQLKISSTAGVIDTSECDRFKRLIFRITRGN